MIEHLIHLILAMVFLAAAGLYGAALAWLIFNASRHG